jgi:hypothetical protein
LRLRAERSASSSLRGTGHDAPWPVSCFTVRAASA